MTVARYKADKGMCDILFSRIVRNRGRCELCGIASVPLDTAHIVRRHYSATRCVEDNAWALCRTHHRHVDLWPKDFMGLVDLTIGQTRYEELRLLAQTGPPLSSKLWWAQERSRLEERCRELGLSTKRAA